MYLHEDRALFGDIINETSSYLELSRETVEKDYYVTMILMKLARTKGLPCVFKGGTSLSKCFHCIDRFSEDIDITFKEHLGEARRKKLKYKILKKIADDLGLDIRNWDKIESDRDYNAYFFVYEPVAEYPDAVIRPEVKLETALASYAFPTETRSMASLVYEFLAIDNREIIQTYALNPFEICVQSLNRTLIDKIFALCDYYMRGMAKRHSRHLYDVYKLARLVPVNEELRNLVTEVRLHRSRMSICPSAKAEVNIREMIYEFCNTDFYRADYEKITAYFVSEAVPYEAVICSIKRMADELF